MTASTGRNKLPLLKLIKYEIVVFHEVYILFHCNSCCFSTSPTVARTCRSVTLYVHCLSSLHFLYFRFNNIITLKQYNLYQGTTKFLCHQSLAHKFKAKTFYHCDLQCNNQHTVHAGDKFEIMFFIEFMSSFLICFISLFWVPLYVFYVHFFMFLLCNYYWVLVAYAPLFAN